MFSFIFGLAIMTFMLWLGFKITGALLKAVVWVFIIVPIALFIWMLALVCICTLILIPVGIKLFTAGLKILLPG